MFEKIKNRVFPFIIALSALSVSASAAFYSVSGLMKLFAGAAFAVGIMAASLEISKLVIASLLYQYWSTLNKALRVYLIVAVSILILITSMGIYGFLSSAYQETANKDQVVTQQITALETKKKLYEDTRDNILKEKQSLSDLRGSLSKGSTTQYTDKKGNLVVRSNNASIKQLDKASQSDDKLSSKMDIVNDSIFSIENKILEIKTNSTSASELGPLKYLSGLTGVSMDRIINYLLLVIIFVFDPLAIALVIAANFAFEKLKQKELLNEITQKDQEMGLYDEKEYEIYKKDNYIPTLEPEPSPEPEPIKQEEDDWVIVDEDAEREKEVEAAIDKIEALTNNISSAEHFKKEAAIEEIKKLKKFLKSNNKDDTITYF
jgi:hypothetical protein